MAADPAVPATANPPLVAVDRSPGLELESCGLTLPSEEGVTVVSQVQAGISFA